ncbi:low affinity iron permease family protein [Streptomyces sp. NPDC003006]
MRKRPSRDSGASTGEPGWFERLAEKASTITASAPFYGLCMALVGAFLATQAAGLSLTWQVFVGDLMTAVVLVLLALLKNSERRAEHAVQRKLDAIAVALLEQREGETHKARDELRRVIGMDEEV